MKNKFLNRKVELKQDSIHIKKYKFNNIFNIALLLMFFISSFSFNVQASSSVLDEARTIIKDNYVTQISNDVLNMSTIEDIIKGLNDPYSKYFSKQEEEDFLNSIDNKMYGIGIYIEMVPEGVKVRSVIEDSPAFEVGIKGGDIITSANGQSLAGLDADNAVSYIKGEEGTIVKLLVKRESCDLTFDVERKEISLPTVTGQMLNNKIAYISIVSFAGDTSELFSKKLQELRMKNPDSYIIDLRNNGGGYMSTAVDIAGSFIGDEAAIAIQDRDGNVVRYRADDKGDTIDKPVIFLVNEYTASASEILSAAVKDYKKAFFIGTNTYGKGVAQEIFPLSDGSSIKLTVEKFYSPMMNEINKVGISPNFEVKDVDSLAVAELFSGKSMNDVDKRGYVKVNVDGQDFEIDLNIAKDENHWTAFKYIVDKVAKESVYIGTETGWMQAPIDYFDNIYKFLYGNFKVIDTLKNVPENKAFTVTFNKSVSIDAIKNSNNIEIIDSETGERAAFDVNSVDDKKVSIIPKENLKKGETYYIKIKDVIRPFIVKN